MLQKSLAYVSQEKCYAATEVLDSKIRLELLGMYISLKSIMHDFCTFLTDPFLDKEKDKRRFF